MKRTGDSSSSKKNKTASSCSVNSAVSVKSEEEEIKKKEKISKFRLNFPLAEFENFVNTQTSIKHEYIEQVQEEIKENISNNCNSLTNEDSVSSISLDNEYHNFTIVEKKEIININKQQPPINTISLPSKDPNDLYQSSKPKVEKYPKYMESNYSRSDNSESTGNFLIPLPVKNFKKKVMSDSSSTYNFFHKEFIPKIVKNQDSIKNKIAFLKSFKPKFIKRENIDKKVIRNFRRYLIEINKKKKIDKSKNFTVKQRVYTPFFQRFIKENLLPPMTYQDKETLEIIDFRSFNTNYMVWLFTKNQAKELFQEFITRNGNMIMNTLKEFSEEIIKSEVNNEAELKEVKEYIYKYPEIYYLPDHTFDNYTVSNDDRQSNSKFSMLSGITSDGNSLIDLQTNLRVQNYYSNKPYEEYLGLNDDNNFEVKENLFGSFK